MNRISLSSVFLIARANGAQDDVLHGTSMVGALKSGEGSKISELRGRGQEARNCNLTGLKGRGLKPRPFEAISKQATSRRNNQRTSGYITSLRLRRNAGTSRSSCSKFVGMFVQHAVAHGVERVDFGGDIGRRDEASLAGLSAKARSSFMRSSADSSAMMCSGGSGSLRARRHRENRVGRENP